ncbi:MAG: ABC transporter ATP-binding protein [Candidatus Nanopelagicaceae bacterium]
MSTREKVLSIKNLSVNFGGLQALSNVNIDLHRGEVLGLIGPNGAGKTTVFNALSGLVTPASGELELYGRKVSWPKPHQLVSHGIARTLQGVGLFPDLTVEENVMIGAHSLAKSGLIESFLGITGKDELRLKERAQSALERAYSGSLTERRANTLAYPDTKRVSIARALVSEPRILLLDEPAGGLGPQDIEWLNGLIKNLKSTTSIIIVEHHMDVVMSICDRISVLNFGELISSGTKDEVRNDPAVIAAYLGTQEAGAK